MLKWLNYRTDLHEFINSFIWIWSRQYKSLKLRESNTIFDKSLNMQLKNGLVKIDSQKLISPQKYMAINKVNLIYI